MLYYILITIFVFFIYMYLSNTNTEHLIGFAPGSANTATNSTGGSIQSLNIGIPATSICSATTQSCNDCIVSSWGDCQTNGTQQRTILQTATGTGASCPLLSQNCAFNALNCKYTAWTPCNNGNQTRDVIM